MRTDFDMQVSGLKEFVTGLHTLGEALPKVLESSASRSIRGVVIPAMKRQMSADFKREGSHKPPRNDDGTVSKPKRGRSGPAERNVTVRKLRRRQGEVVALAAGARAWYAHFPIAGTRPHVIQARGIRGALASGASVRAINRLQSGGLRTGSRSANRALLISGVYTTRVMHPGSRGTDSIRKAVHGVAEQMNTRYVADLQTAYDRHLAGPTRRARPK